MTLSPGFQSGCEEDSTVPASSKSVSATVWALSVLLITMALNVATKALLSTVKARPRASDKRCPSPPRFRRTGQSRQRGGFRHRAAVAPDLEMVADEAHGIGADQAGAAQRPEVAPQRAPQAEPQIGDQHLGGEVAADLAEAAGIFGALAHIGGKALSG